MASKRPKGKKKVFKTYEIGFLVATTPADWKRYIKWFKDALTTPHFEIDLSPPRGAKGDPKKIAAAAAYLASYADIIVTAGTEAALACKEATRKEQVSSLCLCIGRRSQDQPLDPAARGQFYWRLKPAGYGSDSARGLHAEQEFPRKDCGRGQLR